MKGPIPPILTEFLISAQPDLDTFALMTTAVAIYVTENPMRGGYDFGIIYDNGNKDFKNFAGTNFSYISQQAFEFSQAYPRMSYLSDKPFVVADVQRISHITSDSHSVSIGFCGTRGNLKMRFKATQDAEQCASDLRDVFKDTREEKRLEALHRPAIIKSPDSNVIYPAAFMRT